MVGLNRGFEGGGNSRDQSVPQSRDEYLRRRSELWSKVQSMAGSIDNADWVAAENAALKAWEKEHPEE